MTLKKKIELKIFLDSKMYGKIMNLQNACAMKHFQKKKIDFATDNHDIENMAGCMR